MIASGNIAHTHRGGIKAADFRVCERAQRTEHREREGFVNRPRVPKTCALFALAGRPAHLDALPLSANFNIYLNHPLAYFGAPTCAQHPIDSGSLLSLSLSLSPRGPILDRLLLLLLLYVPFQRDLMDRSCVTPGRT